MNHHMPRLACVTLLLSLVSALAADSASTNRTNIAKAQAKPETDWATLFKMHWQNRTKAFKEQNQQLQHVILLGDSITEGFDVARYFVGRRVLNRGIGADVIGNNMPADDPRGVLQRLDNSVFDCAPQALFILIGINDLNSGKTVDSMEQGYREMLKRLRQKMPDLPIYVQSVLPTRGAHAKQNTPVLEFNKRLQVFASDYKCTFIDLHSLMKDDQGELKAEFTEDGLHLTDAAYKVWREQVLRAMNWN